MLLLDAHHLGKRASGAPWIGRGSLPLEDDTVYRARPEGQVIQRAVRSDGKVHRARDSARERHRRASKVSVEHADPSSHEVGEEIVAPIAARELAPVIESAPGDGTALR